MAARDIPIRCIMPTRKDKAGVWHIELCVSRQRVHTTLPPGASARDAKQLESSLRLELEAKAKGRIAQRLAKPADPPMPAVMALYLEHAKHLRSATSSTHHALRIGRWVEGYTASQARECADHIKRDLRSAYTPGTINRSLATLKKALSLAWEAQLTQVNHGAAIKMLPLNNAREVYLSAQEVQTIAQHCTPPAQAAIWAALLTGARRGELVQIRAEHIGPQAITIPSSHTKTLRPRMIPIVPALRPWLAHFPLEISAEGIKSAFRRARDRAGMPHVHFHDLRHSCASILIELGVDLYTVSKILGHASIRMTQRYAHMQIQPQREALERLSSAVLAGQKKAA